MSGSSKKVCSRKTININGKEKHCDEIWSVHRAGGYKNRRTMPKPSYQIELLEESLKPAVKQKKFHI